MRNKPHIMIVEDEGITALGIRHSLEDLGYAVTRICQSGEEAVQYALQDGPDLILMDITLNGEMDGTEAARKIRSSRKIPVVYLTAHTDNAIFQKAKNTEPFGYIVKPFDDRELKIAIEIALYKNKMESALIESRMRYSTLFKTAADSIYLIDAATQKIVECNPEAARLTGYTVRQLKAMAISELHPKKEQDVVASIFSKMDRLKSLSGISGIHQRRADGRLVPVEINATRIQLGGTDYYLGIFRDITVRKQAEEELKNEKNKLVDILNAMEDGIYIVNKDYKIEYVNPSFKKEFRTSVGRTCREYFHGDEKVCPVCKNSDVFTGSAIQWEWTSPKGDSYDIIETPLTNADGSVSKLSILRDISDRKDMEKQLQEAALIDVLTGLFNRRGFFTSAGKRFKLALRKEEKLSLLYLDLNNMKAINDNLGHNSGDSALIDAADIIRQTFRESDIIARIGGDEFAVLLTTPPEGMIENIIIEHLQKKIASFNAEGKRDYTVSMSAGMAHWSPENPRTIDDLMSQADALMYENKKQDKLRPSVERRVHPRMKTGNEFTADLDGPVRVAIKDLSPGGACLEIPRRPHTDEEFKVMIFKDGDEKISVTGKVVWHTGAGAKSRGYIAGIKFINLKGRSLRSLINHTGPVS